MNLQSKIWELEKEIEVLNKTIDNSNEEWAEDDTFIEQVCELNGVEEKRIYGDSYGVPAIQDKVGALVKKLGGKLPDGYDHFYGYK